MKQQSLKAISLFNDSDVVTNELSHQYEVTYPVCALAQRMPWPQRTFPLYEAHLYFPYLKAEIDHHLAQFGKQIHSRLNSTAVAFKLETPFLRHLNEHANGQGIVLLLPDAFAEEVPHLTNQKPTITFARAINMCGYSTAYCWKTALSSSPLTHDLWVETSSCSFERVDNENRDKIYWNDVIIICGGLMAVGGFYLSENDMHCIQGDSYWIGDYRPSREHSEDVLKEGQAKAEAIGSNAPWFEQVCVNEQGRKYKQVEILEEPRRDIREESPRNIDCIDI